MLHVTVRPGREKKIRACYPWVKKNDILSFSRKPKKGELCVVRDFKGRFLAKGYINPESYITIRLLSFDKNEEINEEFFVRRISQALKYREKVVPGIYRENTAFRLIHSEADYIPGFICDVYDNHAVVQFCTYGITLLKDMIINALIKVLKPKSIYEKSTPTAMEIEGLEPKEEQIYGETPETVFIKENGIKIITQIKGGQKTGYFLDQRENKLLHAKEFVDEGDRFLDAFCHVGGFGLHALIIGKAKEAVFVDSSELALDLAKENAKLNNVYEKCTFIKGDCFEILRNMQKDGEVFDSIVIDPPAFAKKKAYVEGAKRGYKELFLRGLKMLPKGGKISVYSCSHHVSPWILEEILLSAAQDARTPLRILYTTYQAKDHPFVLQIPESRYLKGIFARRFEWDVVQG